MPVPFVLCRNPETGATAEVPETALIHLSNWVPVDPSEAAWTPEERAQAIARLAAEEASKPPGGSEPSASPDPQPTTRTAKSKAADPATTPEEK